MIITEGQGFRRTQRSECTKWATRPVIQLQILPPVLGVKATLDLELRNAFNLRFTWGPISLKRFPAELSSFRHCQWSSPACFPKGTCRCLPVWHTQPCKKHTHWSWEASQPQIPNRRDYIWIGPKFKLQFHILPSSELLEILIQMSNVHFSMCFGFSFFYSQYSFQTWVAFLSWCLSSPQEL